MYEPCGEYIVSRAVERWPNNEATGVALFLEHVFCLNSCHPTVIPSEEGVACVRMCMCVGGGGGV